MAQITTAGLDDVLREFERLGRDIETVAGDMLDAGAEEAKKAWAATAEAREYRKSGEMIDSIGATGRGKIREVYPLGKDSKTGVRNATKAFLLHYGTSSIKGSYWVDEAEAKAEGPMTEAMTEVFDNFVKNER